LKLSAWSVCACLVKNLTHINICGNGLTATSLIGTTSANQLSNGIEYGRTD
jgi:hypothetical protein